MKHEDDKAYFSQWNNQELELRLLKRRITSLEAERDSLRKELSETWKQQREELAEQREKINKLMREAGRWQGQLMWFKKSVEMEGQQTIDSETLLKFLDSLMPGDIE